eukprot:Opistho-2@36367
MSAPATAAGVLTSHHGTAAATPASHGGAASYPLHRLVFEGRADELRRLLASRKHDVNERDTAGNPPLVLAAILGRTECLSLLLAAGAAVRVKSKSGWSALGESVSRGARDDIRTLYVALKEQAKAQMKARMPEIVRQIQMIGDFELTLKWDFHSWVPLVSRLLPCDTCKVYKRGATLRLDTTLTEFTDMRWHRGSVSYLISLSPDGRESVVVLDNVRHVYAPAETESSDPGAIEDDVDVLMSADVASASLPPSQIVFEPVRGGLFGTGAPREEPIGGHLARVYHVANAVLFQRKRREHLTPADIARNKRMFASITGGGGGEPHPHSVDGDTPRRPSLEPPPPPAISFDEYLARAPADRVRLGIGRPVIVKESSRTFKPTVWMSDTFPLRMDQLRPLLELLAQTNKHFERLSDFLDNKLPPGFPVKMEMPMFPTVTVTVTFEGFRSTTPDKALFHVPPGFARATGEFRPASHATNS